jgi:hypothetical protein
MSQVQVKTKLFCADNSPLSPKDITFDSLYRNESKKNKLKKNPKYAYYNAFVKMKYNYFQNKRGIYKYLIK